VAVFAADCTFRLGKECDSIKPQANKDFRQIIRNRVHSQQSDLPLHFLWRDLQSGAHYKELRARPKGRAQLFYWKKVTRDFLDCARHFQICEKSVSVLVELVNASPVCASSCEFVATGSQFVISNVSYHSIHIADASSFP